MTSLSPELSRHLRDTLSRCGPFDSDRALRVVFVDVRLAPWRDSVPEADSRAARVGLLIAALLERRDIHGNPALALFVEVLAESAAPGDACHAELTALAAELRRALAGEAPSPTPPPTQALQGGKYEIHIHGGQVGAIGDNAHIEGGIHFGEQHPAAPADPEAALKRARRALEALEEQAAGYTSLTIPVNLNLELEDKRREVVELEGRMTQLPAGGASAVAKSDQRGQQVHTPRDIADDYCATATLGACNSASGNMGDTVAGQAPKITDAALIQKLYQGLQRLDAVELETLCLLHAPQIKDKFGRGQRRDEMINVVLEHCRLKPEDAAELVRHLK